MTGGRVMFLALAVLAAAAAGGCTTCRPYQADTPAAATRARPGRDARDPETWVHVAPPAESSPMRACARGDTHADWVVFERGGKVLAALHARPDESVSTGAPIEIPPRWRWAQPSAVLAIETGLLIAFAEGELGGELFWYRDGRGEGRSLAREPILALLATRFGLFAARGLSHLHIDRGDLIELTLCDEGRDWRTEPFVTLPGAPSAFLSERDRLLVVAGDELIAVSPSRTLRTLHRASWIQANSLAHGPGGTIYVGARWAVIRLTPDGAGYREEWLVPPGCADPSPPAPGERCTCAE